MTDRGEGYFPFAEQPGAEIGRGVEFRVLKHGDGWVVKESINPVANSFDHLKEDMHDYEIFSRYIPDFIPETQHIRGHISDGTEGNILRQREVVGRPIAKLSDLELADENIKSQLVTLFTGCNRMWEQEGRMIDLYGPRNSGLKTFNPRFANNIVIENETNKVWVIDTAANKIGFSKEAVLKYKIPLTMLRFGMNNFLHKLS